MVTDVKETKLNRVIVPLNNNTVLKQKEEIVIRKKTRITLKWLLFKCFNQTKFAMVRKGKQLLPNKYLFYLFIWLHDIWFYCSCTTGILWIRDIYIYIYIILKLCRSILFVWGYETKTLCDIITKLVL